ncbi:hypothetical protein H312_02994 [Anncaliia algerae PRA339]|uniref:Lipoprotein n=1 Tax=Anncaliia algerae PRA339 TaxID=1288291 RepID=A0A059EY45_9MICR|nr:hypothetical protein H312_02994 [Anncaliia algerae PRA339]
MKKLLISIMLSTLLFSNIIRGCFYLPKEENTCKVKNVTSETPCIKQMDKLIVKFHKAFISFSKKAKKIPLNDDSNSEVKEFFENLIHKNFFNGENFPIEYNSELKDFSRLLSLPMIPTTIKNIGCTIFNNIKLSNYFEIFVEEGFFGFFDAVDEFNETICRNLLDNVDYIHEKLLDSKTKGIKVWDQYSFNKISELRESYKSYLNAMHQFNEACEGFKIYSDSLQKQWFKLSSSQKYCLIYFPKHLNSGISETKIILKEYKKRRSLFKNKYKKLVLFAEENTNVLASITISNKELNDLLEFLYDYEILIASSKIYDEFFEAIQKYPKPQYSAQNSKTLSNLKKYQESFLYSKNTFKEDRKLQNFRDLVWKVVLLKSNSKPNILKSFFKQKWVELDESGKKSIYFLIKMLCIHYNPSPIRLKEYFDELMNNNTSVKQKLFSRYRFYFYFFYFKFVIYDYYAEYTAIGSMYFELQKQVKLHQQGSLSKNKKKLSSLTEGIKSMPNYYKITSSSDYYKVIKNSWEKEFKKFYDNLIN